MQFDGQIIHALNVINFPQGAVSKRGGYRPYLTNLGAQIDGLFSFPFQNGTQFFTYAAAGGTLNFSTQGTANWSPANMGTGPGTAIASGQYIGNAVFNSVLALGDGVNQLWTGTNGTAFTNPGSAPIGAQYLAVFHNRLYATDGTSSNVQYSTANDPTNWLSTGTSDSSLLLTPSPGANVGLFVAGDMLHITKNRGDIFTWDDTTLTDTSTNYGPSSPKSLAQIDDNWFYTNQLGIFQTNGVSKSVLSNPIQRQFINRSGQGISGNFFANVGQAIGVSYEWDYLVAVGDLTDDFTGKRITNALIKYDYQKNAFVNWQFADFPTAMTSYHDADNNNQLLFGNASGDCFTYDLTATADNGKPIATDMLFLFTYAVQQTAMSQTSAAMISGSSYEKKWNWIKLFFNPGDECNIQFAFSNTMQAQHLNWSSPRLTRERGQANDDWFQVSDGVVEIRFPQEENNQPRSRFLFLRIYDESDSSQWTYYGAMIDAELQDIK